MMVKRAVVAASAVGVAVGVALLPAFVVTTTVAQQPWDPGCWGPFAWGSNDCDWSPTSGPSSGGPWDPSVTGPGQFNRAGTGSGSTS